MGMTSCLGRSMDTMNARRSMTRAVNFTVQLYDHTWPIRNLYFAAERWRYGTAGL